jgi:hypothetical protein
MLGLLVAQGVFATLVLCTGWSGHFAMEMTHLPSTDHTEDGSCVDVPVLASAETFLRADFPWRPALDDLTPPLIPLPTPISSEADASFRCDRYTHLSLSPSTLPSLRTVILLV